MENQKIYIITDCNGINYDLIIGDESKREEAERTKDFVNESCEENWVKAQVIKLDMEGKIHKGHVNIITIIKLNNTPIRAIANNFYNLTETVEGYMNNEDEYKKYSFSCEFIKIN